VSPAQKSVLKAGYLEKTLYLCIVLNSTHVKVVIAPQFSPYDSFIRQIPALLERGQGEVFYDKRNKVARFCLGEECFIVKRFKRVNIFQQIAYTFFRDTKAKRAFFFAQEFLRRGIATPTPVAYMEQSSLGLFSVGFFVSQEVEGTETHLLLREVEHFDTLLADAVARQVVALHRQGVLHGDLNLSNFLCTQDGEGYHFQMIDINRSHFTDGWPTDEECLKNLVRLTHRRDLYEYLLRSYARERGWNPDAIAIQGLKLLDQFEKRRFKL